jgi:tetratricopeptide (TPR) repeat protein
MMKWLKLSWKIARISGVEVHLHVSLLLSIPITYFIFRPASLQDALIAFLSLAGFLLSILLHEVGHALAARLVKVGVKSIVVWLLGGFTLLGREPAKPAQRLLVDFAGPFVTILLAASFFAVYYFLPYLSSPSWIAPFSRLLAALILINVVLFVFNMLPVYPLDGGNIVHALLELFFGKSAANLITMIVSLPILLGLIALGLYTRDLILLIFCVFIALAISTLNARTLRWANLGINYLFRRGAYYFMQGDLDRAVQILTREIARKPQQANPYIFRSACYVHMLQKEQAMADLQRARELAPDNEMCLLLRGDLYFVDRDYDSALEWYEKACQLHPTSALPHYGRAIVRKVKKEFQAAREDFDKGISLRSGFPICYVERSMVYFRLGNLDAAHKDQESALLLSEKEALTRAEFAHQAYEGYLDWAEDYYGRVLRKQPRSWYAFQGRGDACRANRAYEQAIADYTKAIEINPREPLLYLARGRAYLSNGDTECARADFHQVLAVTDKAYLRRQAEGLLESLNGEEERPVG